MTDLTQKIIWTPLPNGFDGNKLKLSVFVSPRLGIKGVSSKNMMDLKDYDDFWNWPDRLKSLSFFVKFVEDSKSIIAKPNLRLVDESLYNKLFKNEEYPIKVRPYEYPDYSNRRIRSYPARHVLSYIKQNYTAVAENWPNSLPKIKTIKGQKLSFDNIIKDLQGLIGTYEGYLWEMDEAFWEGKKALDPDDIPEETTREEYAYFQAQRFYNRPELNKTLEGTIVPDRPEKPTFDFHQMLTALGDYPILMRKLGLVLDLIIPPVSKKSWFTLSIIPSWNKSNVGQDFAPKIACIIKDGIFRPRPRPGSELWNGDDYNGMLNLKEVNDNYNKNTVSYDLAQIDPDGAALNLLNFGKNISNMYLPGIAYEPYVSSDTEITQYGIQDDAGLPSLRSVGIGLLRYGRAVRLMKHFEDTTEKNNDLLNPQGSLTLFADDLIRGYRVDMLDALDPDQKWRSLCQREGTYAFPDTDIKMIEIAAENKDEEGYVKGASTTSGPEKDSDLYLHESMFLWNGWSLCAKRPGKTIIEDIRMQQDNEDQAGQRTQSIKNTAETDLRLETDIRAKPSSLPSLRFGHEYRMRVRIVDIAGNSPGYKSGDDSTASEKIMYCRYDPLNPPVLVPRERLTEGESLERMVIRSNFDKSAKKYVESFEVRAALIGKDYTYKDLNERHVVPPKTSQLMAEIHGAFDKWLISGDYDTAYRIAIREKGTLKDERKDNNIEIVKQTVTDSTTDLYVIHKEDKLPLPYLPDCIARGAAFRSPGGSDVFTVSFDGLWPDLLPFRLQIKERAGHSNYNAPPIWNPSDRVLTFFLAKAQVAKVLYSCYFSENDLKIMGIWQWLKDSSKKDELLTYAISGAHWMMTPFRELTLVHAIQQPLHEPTIPDLDAEKRLGDTSAEIVGQVHLDVKSTGKIELLAEWNEALDEPNDPTGPRASEFGNAITLKAHIFDMQVDDKFQDDFHIPPRYKHNFGDTKHRIVRYYLRGTTRFREYFPSEITKDPKNISKEGPIKEVSVRNSARPAAPKVFYVIPTYSWEETVSERQFERTRRGGGLRVYLDRPWYSSGEGELLGIVISNNPYEEELKPYVTNFGIDPIWDSAVPSENFPWNPKYCLTIDDFSQPTPNGSQRPISHEKLTLEELSGKEVDVVGYKPEYDKQRNLWYCDIQLNPLTAYYPFVRLALARYQPKSIQYAELSRVVLADFAQLVPSRSLIAKFLNDDTIFIEVNGLGPSERNQYHNIIFVNIEIHNPSIPGELGWTDKWAGNVPYSLEISHPARSSAYFYKWSGNVQLPASRGNRPLRLVVREFELFEPDKEWTNIHNNGRIVYSDTIIIKGSGFTADTRDTEDVKIDWRGIKCLEEDAPLSLAEGYKLSIKGHDGNTIYLELTKNEETVDSKVIRPLMYGATPDQKTYYYKMDIGEFKDVLLMAVHLQTIVGWTNGFIVYVDRIWQISDKTI